MEQAKSSKIEPAKYWWVSLITLGIFVLFNYFLRVHCQISSAKGLISGLCGSEDGFSNTIPLRILVSFIFIAISSIFYFKAILHTGSLGIKSASKVTSWILLIVISLILVFGFLLF